MNVPIHFVTTNTRKYARMVSTLSPHGITVTHVSQELPESQSGTFEDIVCEKVRYAFDRVRKPVIATDSGIAIPVLNGFPGTLTRPVLEALGINRLMRLLAPGEERTCLFQSALAYLDDQLVDPVVFSKKGEYGTLADVARGEVAEERHSIWQVFVPEGHNKTIAEMTEEELLEYQKKECVSGYIEAFVQWFLQR